MMHKKIKINVYKKNKENMSMGGNKAGRLMRAINLPCMWQSPLEHLHQGQT